MSIKIMLLYGISDHGVIVSGLVSQWVTTKKNHHEYALTQVGDVKPQQTTNKQRFGDSDHDIINNV